MAAFDANGGTRWNRRWVNVSTVCVGDHVGRLNERGMRIEDADGQLYRRHV